MTRTSQHLLKHLRLLNALRGEPSPTRIAGYDDDGKFVTLIARGDKLNYERLQLIVDRWPKLSWQDSRIRDTFSRIMTTPTEATA